MPVGGPSSGGGGAARLMQYLRYGAVRPIGTSLGSNALLRYCAPAQKWLVTSNGGQSFDRGKWWMTDDPRNGNFAEIPNVPFNNTATDWLYLCGEFRDHLVFCNRNNSDYYWFKVSLDFSTWTPIGSMQPFAAGILGVNSNRNEWWGYLPNTLLGNIYIVQGSSGTTSGRFWWTNDMGANWFPYAYGAGIWAGQVGLGNVMGADGLPGEEFCYVGDSNTMARISGPVTVTPLLFGSVVSYTPVTPNTKGIFVSRPDGRHIVLSNSGQGFYSLDYGVTWSAFPPGQPAGFGFSNAPISVQYDELTDGFLIKTRYVTQLLTSDCSQLITQPAIASFQEDTNKGTGVNFGGQVGEFIFTGTENNTSSIPLETTVRI